MKNNLLNLCLFLQVIAPASLFVFSSCSWKDESVNPTHDHSFIKEGIDHTYLSQHISTSDLTVFSTQIKKEKIEGDTLVDSKSYKKVVDENGNLIKIVRMEEGRYYGRDFGYSFSYGSEYCFLDLNAKEGESWNYLSVPDDRIITATTLKSNFRKVINDVVYDDLIEVEVNIFNKVDDTLMHWLSVNKVYSRSRGEITSYYPYPLSGRYSHVYNSLITCLK